MRIHTELDSLGVSSDMDGLSNSTMTRRFSLCRAPGLGAIIGAEDGHDMLTRVGYALIVNCLALQS